VELEDRHKPEYHDAEYFEGNSKSGYDKSSFILENDIFKHQAEALNKYYELAGKVVLDIGCARGNLIYYMRAIGIHAWGIDISEWCKRNSHCKPFHMCFDASKGIPFKDNLFDVVVSFETLEHIQNIDFVIEEIKRVMKPDGKFFSTIGIVGHEKDTSVGELHGIEWWDKKISNLLTAECNMKQLLDQDKLVIDYGWSTFCYKK